jgi:hypothetical protein
MRLESRIDLSRTQLIVTCRLIIQLPCIDPLSEDLYISSTFNFCYPLERGDPLLLPAAGMLVILRVYMYVISGIR